MSPFSPAGKQLDQRDAEGLESTNPSSDKVTDKKKGTQEKEKKEKKEKKGTF